MCRYKYVGLPCQIINIVELCSVKLIIATKKQIRIVRPASQSSCEFTSQEMRSSVGPQRLIVTMSIEAQIFLVMAKSKIYSLGVWEKTDQKDCIKFSPE